ncbi:MAG: hypothetical protein HC842_02380 [Cytophagales bacterium]|nr:hypothetical protein [Cytophagales bacterium]
MLDAAYNAIHQEDSVAMVIAAALAPTVESGPENINDPEYLRQIYALGGGDSFDAAAGKPYGFDFSPDDRTVDPTVLNFSRLILLRDVMIEQGDAEKPLWGSNFGWNALPADWTGPPSSWGSVSLQQKVDYTKQSYERAAREWPWVGGLILQHWQPIAASDDPIQGFAIAPYADQWEALLPADEAMMTGLYPAVNPFATYAGDWEFGDLGADAGPNSTANTITISFEGTEFALKVRRGDYLAYLGITIDGQPANQFATQQCGRGVHRTHLCTARIHDRPYPCRFRFGRRPPCGRHYPPPRSG